MIEFTISTKLPSLNQYVDECRKNIHAGAQFKKNQDDIVHYSTLSKKQELKQFCKEPVLIWIEWHEKTKRRDPDNIQSSQKYILDGLQKAGILKNDNNKWVKGLYPSIVYGADDYVCVRLYHLKESDKLFNDYILSEKTRLANELWYKRRG